LVKVKEMLAHVFSTPLIPRQRGIGAPLLNFCKLESFGAFNYGALSPSGEGD